VSLVLHDIVLCENVSNRRTSPPFPSGYSSCSWDSSYWYRW